VSTQCNYVINGELAMCYMPVFTTMNSNFEEKILRESTGFNMNS